MAGSAATGSRRGHTVLSARWERSTVAGDVSAPDEELLCRRMLTGRWLRAETWLRWLLSGRWCAVRV